MILQNNPTGRRTFPDVNLTALDPTLRAALITLRYSDAKRIDRGSVHPCVTENGYNGLSGHRGLASQAPVMVCVYILPGATPVTGPIVLNAPPLWNRKYHSTSQMSGTDRAVSAGRLPTAEPLARNKPTELAEVLQEVRGLEVVATAKVPDGKMEAAAAKNSG